MNEARNLINHLGRQAVAGALGVDDSSISHAYRVGKLPAAWYAPLKRMADEKGLEVPLCLFAWREAKVTTHA